MSCSCRKVVDTLCSYTLTPSLPRIRARIWTLGVITDFRHIYQILITINQETYPDHDEGALGVFEVLLDQQVFAHQLNGISKVLLEKVEQIALVVDHLKVGKWHKQRHRERFILFRVYIV